MKDKLPTLSVVILVHNTSEYLEDCISSIFNQDALDIEAIAVDDGSTDESLSVLNALKKRFGNLTVISQENTGGATAGNRGISVARGKYIALVDSDDMVNVDGYTKLVAAAETYGADIVAGAANRFDSKGVYPVTHDGERELWRELRIVNEVNECPDLFYDCFYWNKIFLRSFIEQHSIKMPDGMLYADRPMVHEAYCHSSKTVIVTDVVYFWRRRDITEGNQAKASITQNMASIGNFEDRIESMEFQLKFFRAFGDDNILREWLLRNIDRLMYVFPNLPGDKQLADLFFIRMANLLEKIGDIDYSPLGVQKNLQLYLLRHRYRDQFMYLLGRGGKGAIIQQPDGFYWALDFYDTNLGIPKDVFRINKILPRFVSDIAIDRSAEGFALTGSVDRVFRHPIESIELEIAEPVSAKIHVFTGVLVGGRFIVNFNPDKLGQAEFGELYLSFGREKRNDKVRISKAMMKGFSQTNFVLESGQRSFEFYFTAKRQGLNVHVQNRVSFVRRIIRKVRMLK